MYDKKDISRVKWFKDARFGMFIHWGVYSILARGEWVMDYEQIPPEEYTLLAKEFNPKKFDAKEWVTIAQEAGMKYTVFTTRHHDGYSLFDSKVSDFTSVKTGANRDFVAEYVSASRKAGMKIGFYYSLIDWRWSAYLVGPKKDPAGWTRLKEYVHSQIKELCTQYGKIDILWYDGGFYYSTNDKKIHSTTNKDWESKKLNAMVRRYQPDILINNRSHLPEDFDTPEQQIIPSNLERPWECCMTMNDSWGYHAGDNNWKSSTQLIHNLVASVSTGGNFLLNIGPRADGSIPVLSLKRLKEIGSWMEINGESIYGVEPCPFTRGNLPFTAKNNTVYAHVWFWPGKKISLAGIKNKVKSAYMLANKKEVEISQRGDRLFLQGLPRKAPDPHDTVIVLKLEGKPELSERCCIEC